MTTSGAIKARCTGFYFLTSTFQRRLWPRIERVNQRHEMKTPTRRYCFWQSVTTMRALQLMTRS